MIDEEDVLGLLLNGAGDSLTVARSKKKCAKDPSFHVAPKFVETASMKGFEAKTIGNS